MIPVHIIFFCKKDRRGALCCFFSKKNENIEADPIGFRPKQIINTTTCTISDMHTKTYKITKSQKKTMI